MNKKDLKGYIAINEKNEAFYIPEGDSPELTIIRVLKGTEFKLIDLSKIDKCLIQDVLKI